MKRVLLSFAAILWMVATYAKVTVTQEPDGTVTIAVKGEAGQIGTEKENYGNKTYEYTNAVSSYASQIKAVQNVIVKGNINATDVKTLVAKNAVANKWTLNTLDMGGATIEKIKVEGSEWYASAHTFMPNDQTFIQSKTFVLPLAKDGILPDYFRACLGNASTVPVTERIILPEGYTKIGKSAFKNVASLSSIVLPNTLVSVEDEAFVECHSLKVIVFPASLKSLGDKVFSNTKLMDVYFLGKEAPIVHAETFDDGTYRGFDSFNPNAKDESGNPIGDIKNGYAERRNYVNGANTFGLLHLRADLTDDERAKYTDITRQYKVEKDANGSGFYHAFYDLYYGNMKIWPGSHSYQHTRDDADRGTLWDKHTPYDKDKYQGLHRFSLTVSNIYNDDTKKWPFDRIKSADQWWTICIPFSMTKAQVRAVFGDDTEVCKMNAVVRDANHKRITLKFQDEQMAKAISDDAVVLQANIAYMIFPTKPLASGEKYIMENYQMETGSPEPTFVKPTLLPAGSGDNGYTYRFIGTYLSQWQQGVDNGQGTPIYMPKHSYFLGQSGDKHVFFYQTGETGRWNPFTATVQVFKGQSHDNIDDSFNEASGAKTVSLFGLADDSTGIDELAVEFGKGKNSVKAVYNLNGQAVRQGTDSLQGLGHGIYIVNGKKYVVR